MKDALFKEIMLSLLIDMTNTIEIFESTAEDVDDLLKEVSKYDPDTILVEESSPLSGASCLVHILMAMSGRPVVVLSQEHNWMHVVQWQTVQLSSANDLINAIKLI
jgi:hypothetical protein